jgi:hypothetical protein
MLKQNGVKMKKAKFLKYGTNILAKLNALKLSTNYNEFDALYEAKEYDTIWNYIVNNLNINDTSKDPQWRALFAFDTIMQDSTYGLCAFYYEEHSNYEQALMEFVNDKQAKKLYANEIADIEAIL